MITAVEAKIKTINNITVLCQQIKQAFIDWDQFLVNCIQGAIDKGHNKVDISIIPGVKPFEQLEYQEHNELIVTVAREYFSNLGYNVSFEFDNKTIILNLSWSEVNIYLNGNNNIAD